MRVRFLNSLVFFLIVAFLLPQQIAAHHRAKVLGETTTASELVFPPVTAGPGFFLPDSPFYIFDKLFQALRLATTFTPEERVKMRAKIAGERMAELRVMLARNSELGIPASLLQLSSEAHLTAQELSVAASGGKDVRLLAKEINDTIKSYRKILGDLIDNTDGLLRLQLKAARHALKEAKVEVEDELPENELENEIEDDVEDEIEDEVENASSSAKGIEHATEVLAKLASQAAGRSQQRRGEALRHAIEVKNEALQKQQERMFKEEEEKLKRLDEAKERAAKEALKAAREAQKAAERFKEAQEKVREIRSTSGGTASPDSSGDSSSNGPGSSGSSSGGSSARESSGSGSSGSSNSGLGRSGHDN